MCLKSWGIVIEDKKEASKEASKDISLEEAQFFLLVYLVYS